MPIAEISILQCPDCGHVLSAVDIRESGELFLAITTCRGCGAEVKVEKPQLGGAYKIETIKIN